MLKGNQDDSDDESRFKKHRSLKSSEKPPSPEPVNTLIDFSIDETNPSCMPNCEKSMETLRQIAEYNKKLPKRRQKKDKLDDISTTNVTATYLQKRDKKKKTLSVVTNYKQVGIIDGTTASDLSKDPFSIHNKQREIQRSSSTLRIKSLRKTYDNLIKLSPPKEPKQGEPIEETTVIQEIDNPFTEDNLDD